VLAAGSGKHGARQSSDLDGGRSAEGRLISGGRSSGRKRPSRSAFSRHGHLPQSPDPRPDRAGGAASSSATVPSVSRPTRRCSATPRSRSRFRNTILLLIAIVPHPDGARAGDGPSHPLAFSRSRHLSVHLRDPPRDLGPRRRHRVALDFTDQGYLTRSSPGSE